jgi:hypothetical protein
VSLDEHYLFSEPFPQRIGDTDQTVAAEEVASGVVVVIHLLAGGNSPVNQEHLKMARTLPPSAVRFLREIGEHRGTPYVVTEPLPDNLSFRAWLGQVTGQPVSAPEPASKPLAASEPDATKFKKQVWKTPVVPPTVDLAKPGEFTQMLRTGGEPVAPKPAPQAIPPPPPAAPKQGLGEFTQMLQTGGFAPAKPAAAPAKPAPPPPPPVPPKQGAGEFTQMLQSPAQARPQTAAPAPAPAPAPWDPNAPTLGPMKVVPPAAPPPAPLPPPQAPAKQGPGEFTQMLQSPVYTRQQPSVTPVPQPSAPPPPAPPPPAAPRAGEFTQMLQTPGSAAAPVAPHFEPMLQPGSLGTGIRPASPTREADEFARMMQQAPPAHTTAPPAAPADFDRTRLFNAPQGAAPAPIRTPPPIDFGTAPAPPPPPLSRDGSPLTSAQPGEFTRMLQSPMAPTPQAPLFAQAEPVIEKTPGGFTQLFESPFGAQPDAASRTHAPAPAPSFPPPSFPHSQQPPASPLYPAKPGARDPNEFDRLFNEPKAPPASGGSTKMFSAPQGSAPAPPVQQGPSEYTLMFKAPAKPEGAPAAPAPAPLSVKPPPAPAVKPPANTMMLIYVLGGLLVVAIAVVAYLLLKK